MEIELPFKAEYAKSGRASCKGCKTTITQGTLRIAAMVQSGFHDGKQANWFHEDCFFKKQRPCSAGDIENFEGLRNDDQERIQKKVDECVTVIGVSSSDKGKKRSKAEIAAVKDYGIEYAKSGRAVCRGCEQKILKDEMRVRKTVYDTEVGMKYGGQPLWHHVECFAQVRGELGWFDSGENLPGFNSLKDEDKKEVKKVLPVLKSEDVPDAKRAKIEKLDKDEEKDSKELIEKIKKQTDRLFEFRDQVKQQMKKKDMAKLLEYNGQEIYKDDSEKQLDQVADLLTFGALLPCSECKCSQMLFHKSGYLCNGNLTEWTKCTNLVKEPERKACKIPSKLKENYTFLKNVRKAPEVRAIRYIPPSQSTISKSVNLKKGDELDGPKVKRERPPLYNLQFALIGLNDNDDKFKKRLNKLGGALNSKISDKTFAVFSIPKEVKRMSSKMQKAKDLGLHIIPIEYLDSVESNGAGAISYITSMTLCDWGTDPSARIPQEETKSSKSKSIYTKSVPKSMTLKIKDGLAVDPESGLDDVAHVYVTQHDKYNVVLGQTDIQRNKNSYYKLQLLQSDNKNKYWVFRSWGRIGTIIGGNKLESFSTLGEAMESFKFMYMDKTGNHFDNRKNFEKAWCDWKCDVRRKLAHNKSESRATGGGSFNKFTLSDMDEGVARVSGLFTVVEGITNSQSFGVNDSLNETLEDNGQSTSRGIVTTAAAANKRRIETTNDNETPTLTEQTHQSSEDTTQSSRTTSSSRRSGRRREPSFQVPGRMYPIDIDYTEDAKIDLSAEHHVKSELPQAVQDIIKLMFDIDNMKRTMLEFDLDMEKMPLGKLSQKQIQTAYQVLTEIHGLIQEGGSNTKFIDATNRFYTLIPHNFGTDLPPLLDTAEQIEKLRQMLDSLLEIEYAYNLLNTEDSNTNLNPLDKHYDQLKTKLEPLDKSSEEFSLLQKYVKNTHAATHNMYDLEVVDIFKVARQGEARRYKPFKKLHNRQLLWHGSRLTNFAGILSHGLKIAPPEAPVTGYMFGKGIYFADMVSKSANYCCTSKQNSTGFMLLSEVALGDMMECTGAKYVTKLPKDKHSCFGHGRTMPDPSESITREDGVIIPLGKPITDDKLKSSLLYNEFIVYDIAQVNIQYMFRMNFKYKF